MISKTTAFLVAQALKEDPHVSRFKLEVEQIEDTIHLRGQVKTFFQKQMAAAKTALVIKEVGGGLRVQDEILVE